MKTKIENQKLNLKVEKLNLKNKINSWNQKLKIKAEAKKLKPKVETKKENQKLKLKVESNGWKTETIKQKHKKPNVFFFFTYYVNQKTKSWNQTHMKVGFTVILCKCEK